MNLIKSRLRLRVGTIKNASCARLQVLMDLGCGVAGAASQNRSQVMLWLFAYRRSQKSSHTNTNVKYVVCETKLFKSKQCDKAHKRE